MMKLQTLKPKEQPAHYSLKVEKKIKKYGRIRNGLFALGVAGVISAGGSLHVFSNYDKQEIAKTYQTAQTTIQDLQNTKKSLIGRVKKFSYQTPKIKELEEMFNSRYDETLVGINEVIGSVEKDISNMETTPEVIQYQQNKKAREKSFSKFYFGGMLSMLLGGFGGLFFHDKKIRLKNKYKK